MYCRRYEECADLYLFLRAGLGSEFTEPTDAPYLSRFCLVEMFTSCTDGEVQLQIIKSLCAQSPLRIVCATLAFGMGIDCTDVCEVVHLGAPDDIKSYIQETGWSARDNNPALALLLRNKSANRYIEDSMRKYNDNSVNCRRDYLFQDTDRYEHQDLGVKCLCCDVCARSCRCGTCQERLAHFMFL